MSKLRGSSELTRIPIERTTLSCYYVTALSKHEKKDGEVSDFGDERLPCSTRWEIQIMAERACLWVVGETQSIYGYNMNMDNK